MQSWVQNPAYIKSWVWSNVQQSTLEYVGRGRTTTGTPWLLAWMNIWAPCSGKRLKGVRQRKGTADNLLSGHMHRCKHQHTCAHTPHVILHTLKHPVCQSPAMYHLSYLASFNLQFPSICFTFQSKTHSKWLVQTKSARTAEFKPGKGSLQSTYVLNDNSKDFDSHSYFFSLTIK